MNVTEALNLIEAAAKTFAPGYAIPRTLRAMCVGARAEDVQHFMLAIVLESQKDSAAAPYIMQRDKGCPAPEMCKTHGGCVTALLRAKCLAAISMVLACMEKAGPDFKQSAVSIHEKGIEEWSRGLAEANGVQVYRPPVPKVVPFHVEPGQDPAEVIADAIRDALIEAAKKPSVQ